MSSGSRILYRIIQASSISSTSCAPTCTSAALHTTPETGHGVNENTEIKGVIFDMDGTLTVPVLNFKEMRARLNLAPGVDMLPTIMQYSPEKKAQAMSIIEKFEEEGIEKMSLQPGVLDLLHYIAERGVRRALMTRNAWKATQVFLDKLQEELVAHKDKYPHLSKDAFFSEVLTRDFQPVKPDPAAVLHICKRWSVEPKLVAVVGDDKTDMICGRRAGAGVNVLLKNERNKDQVDYSDFAVETLSDIISLFAAPITVTRDHREWP